VSAVRSKGRVLVAMSGGVDSSVAAALLVQQGYEVIGATMCLLNSPTDRASSGCCSIEAVEDAKRVADKLNFRHVVLPMQDAFERYVMEDFIEEYKQGRTPNPCIRCNQFLKFDLLLRHAAALDAKWMATGHYARVQQRNNDGRWLLLRGIDQTKDQSYALFRLTQDQLSKTLFPLGEITKKETREQALALGLTVADKPESQEICFVPDRDYPAFLTRVAPELAKPGPLVDMSGKILGQHKGIAFYTVGQRKRLGISTPSPMYVAKIDRDRNTVVVGSNEDLMAYGLVAENINLISVADIASELAVTAKIRYNAKDSEAVVRSIAENKVEVVFSKPQRAITPGQAVVWYQQDIVVGGATIIDECLV
jgi:tRNA-uridine 2-sulfurtransferase